MKPISLESSVPSATAVHSTPAMRIVVREVAPSDEGLLLVWRNDPWIVALGATGRTVTSAEHATWFQQTLRRTTTLLYIIEANDVPCGSMRFDVHENVAEVSIFLLEAWIGQGIGTKAFLSALLRCRAERPGVKVVASVVRANDRSLAFFEKLGFRRLPAEEKDVTISLEMGSTEVTHSRPFLNEDEAIAAAAVIRSRMLSGGQYVRQLEAKWADIVGHTSSVGVGSGLGALRLAMHALGIGGGDEVLLPAYACVALTNAVLSLGAIPVYCDVVQGTWNIDPVDVRRRRSSRSRAIVAVHTFGMPADIDALHALGLPVIEDCAHAVGLLGVAPDVRRRTVVVGSFYATKLVGAGEGGIVSTTDVSLADRIRRTRDYADQPPDAARLNDKLTDVIASIAIRQLDRLAEIIECRAVRAARYHEMLRDLEDAGHIQLPTTDPQRVWYRYVVELCSRDASEVVAAMHRRGVFGERPVWDLQSATPGTRLPSTSRAFERLVSLPLYPDVSQIEQQLSVAAFTQALHD